jgi:tetratricopeptide (TPR) repeat protein
LIESGEMTEAEGLLRTVTSALRSDDFASLRRDVARKESFEIYSSARGDEAAYVSLANRAGLRLASLLDQRGDIAGARREYERVLEMRTDDATALAALARLSSAGDRERHFAAAFDANPFSMALVREYQARLRAGEDTGAPPSDESTGAQVRRALIRMQRGEMRAARETLDALLQKFPNNDTLRTLRAETEVVSEPPAFLKGKQASVTPTEAELRQLIALLQSDRLTPEQRAALDRITFTSTVTFDPAGEAPDATRTVFQSGSIGVVRFKFSEPILFAGTFGPRGKLTYRILGATDTGLLLEPLRLER